MMYPRVLRLGDSALTVEFGDSIDPAINSRVLAFARKAQQLRTPGVLEVVPTYRSATVFIDPLIVNPERLMARLGKLARARPSRASSTGCRIEIPVVYGGDHGPDLFDIARWASLQEDEVVRLHTSVDYRVYMLGFSPGFPYLGTVPDRIATPRLADPRPKVCPGSVGIAGQQTGIYPQDSPGGWRIIGRTPLQLYDPGRRKPFLLAAGDRVRFVAISGDEFERLASHK